MRKLGVLAFSLTSVAGITDALGQVPSGPPVGLGINVPGVAPAVTGSGPPPFETNTWGMDGITPQDCKSYDDQLGFRGFVVLGSPPVCGTVYPSMFGLRPALADAGIGFQFLNMGSWEYDLLGHNSANPQYGGQNPTYQYSTLLQMTYDLSRIGFTNGAQLDVQGVFQTSNFKLVAPHILGLGELAVDQPLLDDRLDLRYGFIAPVSNFYGVAIGGIAFGNAQGPISIIPHEVGLAFNTGTPTAEAIIRPFHDRSWYENFAVSEATGANEIDDNPQGVTLRIHNSRAIIANEFGYGGAEQGTWLRFGQIYNFTPQTSFKTGQDVSGNRDFYGGLTYQLTGRGNINHGLFIDIKGDYAPEDRNYYSNDISFTMSYKGFLKSRPLDTLAIGYQYLDYSSDLRHSLMGLEHRGLPANSNSYTVSEAAFLTSGVFLVSTLSYLTAPAGVARQSPGALTLNMSLAFSL